MNVSQLASRLSLVAGALAVAGSLPAIAAMMAPPSISIVSPSPGQTVRGADIPVNVAVSHFKLECANIGKTNAPMGEGHVHVMVDGLDMAHLIGPFCTTSIRVPGRALAAGKHTLTVALATDAHALNSAPVSVSFNYEPRTSNAAPRAMAGGKPVLRVVSPTNGATVPRRFNLVVAVRHFDLSCDLEGKRDIAGWGHIHVMVQQEGETSAPAATPLAEMMRTPEGMKMGQMLMKQTGLSQSALTSMLATAMPSMVAMPCTKIIPVDLSTWRSGPAKIIVQLANNDHMPTAGVSPVVLRINVK